MDPGGDTYIGDETAEIVKSMPNRISQITVFVSVTLIIILIMVAAHVVRLIMAAQKMSKTPEAPTAIVIQPKHKHKKAAKQKKKASLACKHRSNYNLPSKLMMVDIEVKKETEEQKKKKKKEAELVNPVTNMAITAPPPYKTLKPTEGLTQPSSHLTMPPLAKEGSSRNSEFASGKQSPTRDAAEGNKGERLGETVVTKTVKTETVTRTMTSGTSGEGSGEK